MYNSGKNKNMNIKLGVIMDPISSINVQKDSTFAMLIESQKRGFKIFYMEVKDIFWKNKKAYGISKILQVNYNLKKWFNFIEEKIINLSDLDVILMRKDPPFDMEFIYCTYILEFVEKTGVLIINKPKSLRNCNEKIFTCNFKNIIPNTLISKNKKEIKKFIEENNEIIVKPLDAMGGHSIFKISKGDPNISVIIETMTKKENRYCIAQNYISDIKHGDKRILIINGKPISYCLARIPLKGEVRGNLASGGIGKVQPITKNDLYIVEQISKTLKKRGLLFVGIDIIGNFLTEINITSPTCIIEIEKETKIPITKKIINMIEKKIYIIKKRRK